MATDYYLARKDQTKDQRKELTLNGAWLMYIYNNFSYSLCIFD